MYADNGSDIDKQAFPNICLSHIPGNITVKV